MSDRTVHAELPDGVAVVRYDRAGKWFIEGLGPDRSHRTPISLGDAVQIAHEMKADGGRVYLDRPGGGAFDAKYRKRAAK